MFSSVFDDTSSSEVWSSNASALFGDTSSSRSSRNPPSSLEYVVNHIFFPVYHPPHDDYTHKSAHALAYAVHTAARAYNEYIDHPHWLHITKMLENLQAIMKPTHAMESQQDHTTSQFSGMKTGDMLVFPSPYDDETYGVIFRKEGHCTLFESFNVFSQAVGSCPELAIEIPNGAFDDGNFRSKLASLLMRFPIRTSGGLLTDTLRGVGHPVKPKYITKHIGPTHIIQHTHRSKDTHRPLWSRSRLWFLIRATIQSSLDRSPLGHGAYKAFMLFFMCSLANYAVNTGPPSVLLHSMSAKILRRFRKLGSSAAPWLYDAVLHTCAGLSRILDQRWQEVQVTQCSLPLWDPSQLDLTKDTYHSLPHIHEYISTPLANHGSNPPYLPFLPDSRLRSTLDGFLSLPGELSLNHYGDIHVTLYDFERAVGEDLDNWVACVTNVDEACEQLEDLVERYILWSTYYGRSSMYDFAHLSGPDYPSRPDHFSGPDHLSIVLLTIIELWIALDKLVVREAPILADYSPEVPIDLLCRLLLRDAMSIHRLCRAYQYLFARHNRAHTGWSVLSNEFTEDSFPCRYYDISPHIQHLKARIEDTLPVEPLHAKVVVFELQCPVFFDTWRSVTCRLCGVGLDKTRRLGFIPVRHIPSLKPHVLVSRRSSLRLLSLYSRSAAPQCWEGLYYAYEGPCLGYFQGAYQLPTGSYADSGLRWFLDDTKHTSNEVLAAQANCHPDLSLHEFITFAHLRSGGSLQWFNILRELRSSTLNFRHQEVYLLLAQASAQAGPPDSTGELLWHQEIQDPSFCHALLDELEGLFMDVGVGSLNGPAMAIISLLASVLTSRSTRDISERAIQLLRGVRRKTFDWVYELLYDVRKSPANEGSLGLLRDMAAVCRSTFDVGSATSHKLFHSAQDIQAALACAMLIRTIGPPASSGMSDSPVNSENTTDFELSLVGIPMYSQVLLDRGRRLSLAVEGSLRDAIQADTTDLGVDRSVQMIWPHYRPSSCRWEPLQPPNSRWLVCQTAPTMDRPSQTVHINLLDGSLLVDSKPSNKLPSDVTRDSGYRKLFGDRDLMVVASDLPGMDYVTTSVIHNHHIHFTIRSKICKSGFWEPERVIIRAQSNDTDDIFELIPREKLQGDLPKSLLEDHVHWLNLSTLIIEIRPIEEPWKQSLDNWTIHLRPGQSCVTKGGEFLVGKQSPTWAMVSSRFRYLDDPENIIITVSQVDTTTQPPTSLRLSVALPRYGLSFFVNENGNFESHDFKDMVYDEDQCIGTLFGLVNRLVLCPKAQIEDLVPKCVIIPHGNIRNQDGHGVHVKLPSSGPVIYHAYEVDSELGCLKGAADLESRLYLARLHALTGSEAIPDPLTGRTGLEEAISIIWLAGTRTSHVRDSDWPQSPQIRFALAKIQDCTNGQSELPSEEHLLREAYLFPSEVVVAVQLSRIGSLALLDQLLHDRPVPNLPERNTLPCYNDTGCHGLSQSANIEPLRQLFTFLRTHETAPPFQSQYITRLHSSADHIRTTDPFDVTYRRNSGKPGTERLHKHYVECRTSYTESLSMVKMALSPKTELERIIDQCGQWPRITPFILFRCLASTSPTKLPESWKKCLISLALLALDVQRARRLLLFSLDNLEEELSKELENEGCDGWDAAKHPDWLLIQLQGNFLIRRVQADIAKEMMSPRSGKNTVMQVNMGEGKTSVIIPICAAALADGNQLVRVIVPKALIPHTLQVLTDRLSGLVNKPVYHLTFSRDSMNIATEDPVKINKVELALKVMPKFRHERGIVVMQPEHVLSLKLACVEMQLLKNRIGTNSIPVVPKWGFERALHMLTGSLINPGKQLTKSARVSSMKPWHRKPATPKEPIDHLIAETVKFTQADVLKLQKFLATHARDILDESDDVLRPQFQLIYSIGYRHPFEGSPDRWLIVQQVLGLVKRHAYLLSTHDSHAIRCDGSSPGSFPYIHILQASGGDQLISLFAQDVLDGRLPSLSFHCELGLTGAIREFMLRKNIHPDTVKMVEEYARQSTSWGSLLLLRGLLAHNILLFALTQRRWRVNYGLDPTSPPRTMLAIPYRAKDVPAETAEFGHPDITILLTCLSYYYGGLSSEQLRISFELLLQQDDPSSEYALWLKDCDTTSVPIPLQKLSGVNTRSLEQWDKYLVPLFTRNKRVIDLYLSKTVFPNHAKEFPKRISGSYWDIAEQKNHLVTGFSGTNDGQYLLPTSITQDNPDHLHQTGTNARVLAYLLQPENSSYIATTDENGERWTTLKLLRMIVAQKPEIRVLLDVGAQILDLSNLELVRAWLDCTPATKIAGAIYFSEDDKLMVLARNGITQPLSSSPLAHQLHRCVAYLDDAHTRGTDLKFPCGFRAAVTLGHKVTKDRLVQGCMRMRKLGHGHSVMFFAPHEVDQRIRGLIAKENPSIRVTTVDVLHLAIRETWNDIQRQALYWAQQGMSHQSRYEAWSRFCQSKATPNQLADAWIQPELKSLADMYMPHHSADATSSAKLPRQIRERCESLGVLSLPDVRMDEEQEREVSREIEREREVERPPRASPATHFLHPDVVKFVATGVLASPSRSKAFRHIFATDATSASSGPHAWSPYILATADFCETITESESVQGRENDFLRPVQWVLSGKMNGQDALVLLSPFEADLLMPQVRISEHVHLHLYIPRTTKRMKPSDDLRLYSVPPLPSDWIPPWSLIDQLNLFSGQLYLRDYPSYVRLCRFLGVHTEDFPQSAGTVVARNWFSNPHSSDAEIKNRFEGTPLPFVMQLFAIRRGMEFAETHMGRILDGWPLTEEDFRGSTSQIVDTAE